MWKIYSRKILARLEDPTDGDVYIENVSTSELMRKEPRF